MLHHDFEIMMSKRDICDYKENLNFLNFFFTTSCQENPSDAICNFMTFQRSSYSLGEIVWEIVIFYPHLLFQLHEITLVVVRK